MIQELRTLLLNDTNGSTHLLMPSLFSNIPLSQVETEIRKAILGPVSSSIEYKCFVADKLFNAIYRDSEFEELLSSVFDKRVFLNSKAFDNIIRPDYSITSGGASLLVDLQGARSNRQKRDMTYSFSKNSEDESGMSIVVSGGVFDKPRVVSFTNSELMTASKWKEIDDTGALINLSSVGESYAVFDGGGAPPEIIVQLLQGGESSTVVFDPLDSTLIVSNDYDASIDVTTPFEFDAQSMLEDLISIQGLIDFMYLIGYDYPELLQKFLSDGRRDRKLFSILVAYGISVKRKAQ